MTQIGGCPYCGHSGMWGTPEQTPAFARTTCEGCHKRFWLELSRIDPKAWTIEDFEAAHDIDHETRKITRRAEVPK